MTHLLLQPWAALAVAFAVWIDSSSATAMMGHVPQRATATEVPS